MTADQAHCLLLPPAFAASVLCVVVHVLWWLSILWVWEWNMFVFVAQYSRKLHIKHMEHSNTSPIIILVQCATVNRLCVSSTIYMLKYKDIYVILLRNTYEHCTNVCHLRGNLKKLACSHQKFSGKNPFPQEEY